MLHRSRGDKGQLIFWLFLSLTTKISYFKKRPTKYFLSLYEAATGGDSTGALWKVALTVSWFLWGRDALLVTNTPGSSLLENLTLSSLSTPPAEGSLKEGNQMLCSRFDERSNRRTVGQDRSSFQIHSSPLGTHQKILSSQSCSPWPHGKERWWRRKREGKKKNKKIEKPKDVGHFLVQKLKNLKIFIVCMPERKCRKTRC